MKSHSENIKWSDLLPLDKLNQAEELSKGIRVRPVVAQANIERNASAMILAGVGGDEDDILLMGLGKVMSLFETGVSRGVVEGKLVEVDKGVFQVATRMAAIRCHGELLDTVQSVRAKLLFNRGMVSPSDLDMLRNMVDVWDVSNISEYQNKQFLGIVPAMTTVVVETQGIQLRLATESGILMSI